MLKILKINYYRLSYITVWATNDYLLEVNDAFN